MQVYQNIMQPKTAPIGFYDVCFVLVMAADGACPLPTKQQEMMSLRERMGTEATCVEATDSRVTYMVVYMVDTGIPLFYRIYY